MKTIVELESFNLIQDEENYYFFRALNMGDNQDIEAGVIIDEQGKKKVIRTDRDRYVGNAKYSEDSKLSLEEIYDHIKMHHRIDTNCISLTTNGNIAINYGRSYYKDKYVMIKIPKKEFGENTVFAAQYMLREIETRIKETIEKLPEDKKQNILSIFENIEDVEENSRLKDIITKRYTAQISEVNLGKAHLRKGITYGAPHSRIVNYQALNEEQLLEINKIYAKLAILENEGILKNIILHSPNSKLRETIGNAFSSTEVIHYGAIKQENIVEVSKEIVDLFAMIQQIDGIDESKINALKQALLTVMQNNVDVPQIPEITEQIKNNISIEEMYELTEGKVEYGKASSVVKSMFYLSKSRKNAIELSNVLKQLLGTNSELDELIQYIKENGFRVEPEIISRKSGKGVKLSETVNLDLEKEEQGLIDEIKQLFEDDLDTVLQNGGLYNAKEIITSIYGDKEKKIDKSRYYAEAIFSKYNWQNIGIEEFREEEREEIISRLQERDCIEIYSKLKGLGIEENLISTYLLNIVTREGFYEKYKNGNLEELVKTRKEILDKDINIEIVERFLGYYDLENTGIKLKEYQKRADDNVTKIFEDHKFAQVILPTGAGKSFVALAQMLRYAKEHPNEKMLYLAPQDEILNQMKKYIIKYLHGSKGTIGKKDDEILAEIFPNIQFETYSGLLAKRGQEIVKEQYGMIVLDELHRTGAPEWEDKVDELFENQNENVKVLGITATPTRDVDDRDMANETAKKLGYTDEEIKHRKHIAANMTLENAIRMGFVVNPKVVYCKYDLISSGKMDELREEIEDIEDPEKKAEKLAKYNELRARLNKEIDEEIGEDARKKLEEDARKNLDSGIGKEEILRQHVKKGGKYIIFIPVTDQGDIEDEDGNRIGTKTGEDKIKAYQEYLKKVFKGTDIELDLHSMLGSYSKEKNKKELDAFESDNSDKTKFMVVMNKANEGIHIAGVDGIVWFRALDEDSKILYLQQLGRCIFALDEDNPLPEEKRPIVIDLANNTLTVNIEKDFKNIKPIDDLESLKIVTEWINEHDEMIPNGNSTNKLEQHYYAILRRIQAKYSKYLDGFENFEKLTEDDIERIGEIIDLATEIDLWNIDLPPIQKELGSKEEFDPFSIEGILRDFVEFDEEIEENITSSVLLKNLQKIENWCKENFGDKEKWERRLPNNKSNDKTEKSLGKALQNIKQKLKRHEEIENEEYKQLVEKIRKLEEEYAFGHLQKYENLGKILEIKNWCEKNFGGKEKWERRLPVRKAEDEKEKRLSEALSSLRYKLKKYEGKDLKEIENEEEGRLIESIRQLEEDYAFGYLQKYYIKGLLLEIENWCEKNFGGKEKWERRLPGIKAEDEKEKRLGQALHTIKIKIKKYEGIDLKEIENEEDRQIVEKISKLEEEYAFGFGQKYYSLGNILEIENWCKENFENKEKWERRLPSPKIGNETEKRLGFALNVLNKKLKKYEGKELKEIENEEDRYIVEKIRKLEENYAYGWSQKYNTLGIILKIENWCKKNFEDKEKWERRLPSSTSEDEIEKKLSEMFRNQKHILKKYEGKELKEIENKEDRYIVEKIRQLEAEYAFGYLQKYYSLGNILEIENWCKENFENKEKWERRLPSQTSKDEKEKRLGQTLHTVKAKLKKYEGKELEEIENEEDRQLVEKLRFLDEEYNSRKKALKQAKSKRDKSKEQNEAARELEKQTAEELKKRGKNYEEQ